MRRNYLKKLIVAFYLVIGFTTISFAQLSEGGTPLSFEANLKANIDNIALETPNVDELLYEDGFCDKNCGAVRVGVPIEVGVNPETAGTWTELPNGDRVWRLEIESKGAKFIGVYYNSFKIPKNGKLFLYSADKSRLIGAFTSKNNPKNVEFATEMIPGDKVIIEYNETATNQGTKKYIAPKLDLDIDHIIYFYKGLTLADNHEKASDACEVNVICSPVGDDWQDEKRGVARIEMNGYLCSGTLINNTAQDCTPYFLTAYHCAADQSASEHNQWVFYFGYEATTCSGTTGYYDYSITGCSVKALSDISGGSDLQLVELNSTPTTAQNPYYNGWSRSTTASTSGVSIHHPAGDIKKISTYTQTLQTYTYSGAQSNAHWLVYWSSNANGWGVTEGGSSGSPIFNPSGLVVGTLTGGSSYCDQQSSPDMYGKMDKHWTNGNLATYLDPASTGATSLAGTNAPCGGGSTVTANFTASSTTVVVGSSVTFTDQSIGAITSRNWTFGGGTPGTSTATNPTITYNSVGDYNVSLTVSDGTDSDTKNETAYIHVVNAGTTCDTLDVYGLGTSSGVMYSVQNGGYLAGSNGYGDAKKANFYPHSLTTNNNVEGVLFYFGRATSGTNPNISFEIYDGSTGTPGSVLTSVSKPLSEIADAVANNGGEYYVDFGGFSVTSDFFVSFSCDLNMANGDTIAIITNTDGDVGPNVGWEQWSDGVWYAYSDANAWELSISNAMFPILCPDATAVNTINSNSVKIFPNPTTGVLNITGIDSFNQLQILDINGKVVKTTTNYTNSVNVSNLTKGNYIIRIVTDNSVITKRFTLIK